MQSQLKTLCVFSLAPPIHRPKQYVIAPLVILEYVTPIYNTTLHRSFIIFYFSFSIGSIWKTYCRKLWLLLEGTDSKLFLRQSNSYFRCFISRNFFTSIRYCNEWHVVRIWKKEYNKSLSDPLGTFLIWILKYFQHLNTVVNWHFFSLVIKLYYTRHFKNLILHWK